MKPFSGCQSRAAFFSTSSHSMFLRWMLIISTLVGSFPQVECLSWVLISGPDLVMESLWFWISRQSDMVIIPHWHRRKSASIYLSAQCLTLHRQPRSTPPRTSLINRRNPRFHSLFPLVYSPIIRNPPRKSNTNGGSSGKGSSPSANMRLRMRWHGMIGLQLGVHIYKEYSYFGKNTKEHYY